MKRNGTEIAWKERLKSKVRSYYQERVLSRERILNQKCVLNHLEIIETISKGTERKRNDWKKKERERNGMILKKSERAQP